MAVMAVLFLFLNPAGGSAKDLTAVGGNKTHQQHPCLAHHMMPLGQTCQYSGTMVEVNQTAISCNNVRESTDLKNSSGILYAQTVRSLPSPPPAAFSLEKSALLFTKAFYSLQQCSWHNTTLLLVCQSQSLRTVFPKPFNPDVQSYHLN